MTPQQPTQKIGRYEIVKRLASGGMGTVYLARMSGDAGFHKLVALKCCHPHLAEDQAFATMFLNEARLAARIRHPNVVATLDVGAGDPLFLVMEYVEGASLAALLAAGKRSGQRLPVAVTLRIVSDMLAGLHAAHELVDDGGQPLRLVHRDVSPPNVLVGRDGLSRLADFGVAKAIAGAPLVSGQIRGKIGYIAPEQIRGEAIDRRADLFSTGVVLWEALAGRRLFHGDSDAAILTATMAGGVPAPSTINPQVPPALDALVTRALALNPADRFGSAAEMADAIEALPIALASARTVGATHDAVLVPASEARGRSVDARDAAPPAAAAPAPDRKRTPRALVVLAASAAIAALAGALLLGGREETAAPDAGKPPAVAPAAPSLAPLPEAPRAPATRPERPRERRPPKPRPRGRATEFDPETL